MPTTYTHYRFGKDVLASLPVPQRQAIEQCRELYDIGLHGPDILFYYRPVVRTKVASQGSQMHKETADLFFNRAARVIGKEKNPAAARAYLYGFICHFALDSECHPYVEKMIQASGITHAEIEMELDRMLMVEDGIDPLTHPLTNHIHPTKQNAVVIAPFFKGRTVGEIKESLQFMIYCHRLFLAPGKKKRSFVFAGLKIAGMYEHLKGTLISYEPNPDCADFNRILKRQYDGAVPLAVSLIMDYQKTLFEQKELPERFHRTFGEGDDWENLSLEI